MIFYKNLKNVLSLTILYHVLNNAVFTDINIKVNKHIVDKKNSFEYLKIDTKKNVFM